MTDFMKIVLGWIVWTSGALTYAHLTTNAALPERGEATFLEFTYGAMGVSYLIGVPILTILWVVTKRRYS